MKLAAVSTVLALAVGIGAAPAAASGVDAGAKRACTSINLGGPKVFSKHNIRCQRAKDYARRLFKTRGDDKPPNFKCSSGSNFRDGGFCEHKTKDKNFAWHPADKRKATSLDDFCSPTGDFCLGVLKRKGRIKLEISTFSFRGRYQLCVNGPGSEVCKRFGLDRDQDVFADRVDWARKFPDQGQGRYRASWHKFGDQLGKTLRFNRGA